MLRVAVRFIVALLLIHSAAFAQTPDTDSTDPNTIKVGVANVLNRSRHAFNTGIYRAQLVRFLNDFGDDKKEPVVIEAIALKATSRKDASSEAASKGCHYLLLTTVREFSAVGGIGGADGGITAIPGVNIGTGSTGSRNIVLDFEASQIGRLRLVSEGSLQPRRSVPVDEQITELVQTEAMRVAHDLRKDRVDRRMGE